MPVVLAAGFSSRMGQRKALLSWRKTTFLGYICGQLARAGLARPVVVIPASDDEICRVHSTLEVKWARNAHPEEGMLSSVRAGLKHVPRESDVMLCLVDHPAVRVRTYRALARMACADRIVIPVWQGRRGHPVVFGRRFREELEEGDCPEGARSVVEKNLEAVRTIAVCDRGIVCDVDTAEEYAYLVSKGERKGHKGRKGQKGREGREGD